MFARRLIILSFHVIDLLIWDAGTKAAGEQGGYYDLLFMYREGDEASYFVSDEPEGREADVGPSSVGEGRESLIASSLGGLTTEPVASATVEEELSAVTITEALRTDEHLPEPASGDLTGRCFFSCCHYRGLCY